MLLFVSLFDIPEEGYMVVCGKPYILLFLTSPYAVLDISAGSKTWITDSSVALSDSLTWWQHDMEMHSTLLALCEGNPSVTDGFPSQRASNAELWCFLCCHSEQAEQTVKLPVIRHTMMLMWCRFNDSIMKLYRHSMGHRYCCIILTLYAQIVCIIDWTVSNYLHNWLDYF